MDSKQSMKYFPILVLLFHTLSTTNSRQSHFMDYKHESSTKFDTTLLNNALADTSGNKTHLNNRVSQKILILVFTAGQFYLSRGCHSTELKLSCPEHHMIVVHSAFFTQSQHQTASTKLNCSSVTQHSVQFRYW